MNSRELREHPFFKSALGAGLAVLCGLALWNFDLGEAWRNASYDYLFRFGSRPVTNQVVVILMDNQAYYFHKQERRHWDRGIHAELLQRLADDGCALVVLDSFLRSERNPTNDAALAAAMQRLQPNFVLMAEQTRVTNPAGDGVSPMLPTEPFLSAVGKTNWGVGWLDSDLDSVVRRHWPFPSPAPYRHLPSLPMIAAQLAGASLSEAPQKRWLRYYGATGPWTNLSYRYALELPANYYRDKFVFIGSQPNSTRPGDEPDEDEFRTPYTLSTNESMGGVQIMVTSFLNLLNGDWLRRPAWGWEALVLVAAGILIGGTLPLARPWVAFALAGVLALAVALGGVSLSYFTNYWFPWLVIAGGQVPCALAWALAARTFREPVRALEPVGAPWPRRPAAHSQVTVLPAAPEPLPDTPDYELLNPPFGRGAYGKVWLARNAIGQWQALKVIYLASFGADATPYEREFNGIKRYKPISDKHPGLLRVDFVSNKKAAGYFYYVMELGDPLEVGWERSPSTYKPRDLTSERRRARGEKLPVRECVRIGLALADALDFLHRQGLTHRDIKPQNVIFVNNRPKLADVGLIAEIRPPDEAGTNVGTPGYMPPPPELPGTPQADIFALGMMLFVLSTGRDPTFFPEISTTLANSASAAEFVRLNKIILTACEPDAAKRYASAAEMHRALWEVQTALEQGSQEKVSSSAG